MGDGTTPGGRVQPGFAGNAGYRTRYRDRVMRIVVLGGAGEIGAAVSRRSRGLLRRSTELMIADLDSAPRPSRWRLRSEGRRRSGRRLDLARPGAPACDCSRAPTCSMNCTSFSLFDEVIEPGRRGGGRLRGPHLGADRRPATCRGSRRRDHGRSPGSAPLRASRTCSSPCGGRARRARGGRTSRG